MVSFGLYQLLSNSALYEHRYLGKIKKLYKSAGKCDNQQKYTYIIESAIVYTPEGLTGNSPMPPGPYIYVKNKLNKISPEISESLDVKHKTAVCRLVADRLMRKSIIAVIMLWYIIKNRIRDAKTN